VVLAKKMQSGNNPGSIIQLGITQLHGRMLLAINTTKQTTFVSVCLRLKASLPLTFRREDIYRRSQQFRPYGFLCNSHRSITAEASVLIKTTSCQPPIRAMRVKQNTEYLGGGGGWIVGGNKHLLNFASNWSLANTD
jgi:hypothetical protein